MEVFVKDFILGSTVSLAKQYCELYCVTVLQ